MITEKVCQLIMAKQNKAFTPPRRYVLSESFYGRYITIFREKDVLWAALDLLESCNQHTSHSLK
jgi:hypothetical protein